MIELIAGIFIGIALTIWAEFISLERENIKAKIKETFIPKEKTQFVDPVSFQQKFDEADNINDILN